jgi:ABC-type polysaccharide/polyol phosphate export permease
MSEPLIDRLKLLALRILVAWVALAFLCVGCRCAYAIIWHHSRDVANYVILGAVVFCAWLFCFGDDRSS